MSAKVPVPPANPALQLVEGKSNDNDPPRLPDRRCDRCRGCRDTRSRPRAGTWDVAVTARFDTGERVRARDINPVGHTRLVRYARGKTGTIHMDHGVFLFPDTNALFLGEKPQHVYSVRFTARELWGEQAPPQDSVYIDMWDDYLEPAQLNSSA